MMRCATMLLVPGLLCGCSGDGTVNPSRARIDDLAGLWSADVVEPSEEGAPTRVVWELMHTPGDDLGSYLVHHGQQRDGRAWLTPVDQGLWYVEDGHLVTLPGGGPAELANEILTLSDDALTLESRASATGRLDYTRQQACPEPMSPEGWTFTDQVYAAGAGTQPWNGVADVVVDDAGLMHTVVGNHYAARLAGCRWASYVLGPTDVAARLVIDGEGRLHLIQAGQGVPTHRIGDPLLVPVDDTAWTLQAPGPLQQVNAATGEPFEVVVDGEGAIWTLLPVPNDRLQPGPTLFRFDGAAWSQVSEDPVLPFDGVRFTGRAWLTTDEAGAAHLVTLDRDPGSADWGLHIRDAATPTAPPRVVPFPSDIGYGEVSDVLVDTDGDVHVACNRITPVQSGPDEAFGCYGRYEDERWTLTQLGPGRVHAIERTPDGSVALVGGTVWQPRPDGTWHAPGPPFRDPGGTPDVAIAWHPDGSELHLVGQGWFARYEDDVDTTLPVSIAFTGRGEAAEVDIDAAGPCDADCTLDVRAGYLHEIALDPGPTSNVQSVEAAGENETATPYLDANGR